jgi:carboxyl-terminal processing protease
VQNTKDVGYNAKVKLTIAKYYIPSGRCIQSVSYDADGNKIHLPDSLKSAFKTRSGRTVYDGGGIMPDVEVKDANYPPIINKLIEQNHIFNYVTRYCLSHTAPADPSNFEFTEVDDFIKYLREVKFDDQSILDKKIAELDSLARSMPDLKLDRELAALRNTLEQDQWKEIEKHKSRIAQVIGESIVERSHFERGLLINRLVHDPLVQEANGFLLDPAKYRNILKLKG